MFFLATLVNVVSPQLGLLDLIPLSGQDLTLTKKYSGFDNTTLILVGDLF